jgi:hypothetical protein
VLSMGENKFLKDDAIDRPIAQAKQEGSHAELEALPSAARRVRQRCRLADTRLDVCSAQPKVP